MEIRYSLAAVLPICFALGAYGQSPLLNATPDHHASLTEVHTGSPQTVPVNVKRNEVWFISARGISDPTKDLSQLVVQQCHAGRWSSSSLNELCQVRQETPEKKTVVYVHGNRTDQFWAKHRGRQVYRNLFSCKPSHHGPVRFIIWSWKSDQTNLGVRDFNLKSQRAINMGAVFSATLNALGTDNPPLLIGYSLGCQIIAQAIVEQAALPEAARYNMAFVAPVLHCHFPIPKPTENRDMNSNRHSIMFVNRKDLAVWTAKQICARQTCGNSLSFEKWAGSTQQPLGVVRSIDITGKCDFRHSILKYSGNPVVRRNILNLLESTD